jgi:hypothetical protein
VLESKIYFTTIKISPLLVSYYMVIIPFLSTTLSYASTDTLYISIDIPLINISYKLNHIKCGLLWPVSLLSMVFSKFTHVVVCISTPFICGQIIFHFIDMSQLFIHSSVNDYLICFKLLVTRKVTAANIHVQVFVWTSFHFSSFHLGA